MLFVSALVAATFIDLDHFEIPEMFSIGLGVAGVLLSFLVPSLHDRSHEIFVVASLRSGTTGLHGLLVGSALVLWIAILSEVVLKKEAMGFGDVKFVGAIGAFCGWQGAVTSIFGGALIGLGWLLLALLWQLVSGKKILLKSPEPGKEPTGLGIGAYVPYGPMLAIAGLAHFFYLHRWVNSYFSELASLL